MLVFLLSFMVFFSNVGAAQAQEFLYPVTKLTTSDGSTKVLCIWQKSPTSTQAWLWDLYTHRAEQVLPASTNPAGLQEVPGGSRFSFLESGRIRIKELCKRSHKTLAICEPLYEIGNIEWVDEQSGYFSAKRQENFCIFSFNCNGDTERIVGGMGNDCMYPQKVDDVLFYIERCEHDGQYCYEIIQMHYPESICDRESTFNSTENYAQRVEQFLKKITFLPSDTENKIGSFTQSIVNFKNSPIAFLTMLSQEEGFVIEHASVVDKTDQVIMFSCHHLKKENEIWSRCKLFDFSIPSRLLICPSDSDANIYDMRLYESIIPLLPRYTRDFIYFVHCVKEQKDKVLTVFQYNRTSKVVSQKAKTSYHLFSPLYVDDMLLCGGQINNVSFPFIYNDEQGFPCFSFFNLKNN